MIQSTSAIKIKPATSSEVVPKEYSESPRVPSITKLNEHEMVSSQNTWPSKSQRMSKNLQRHVTVCRICHRLAYVTT